jgi:hypothetical protein
MAYSTNSPSNLTSDYNSLPGQQTRTEVAILLSTPPSPIESSLTSRAFNASATLFLNAASAVAPFVNALPEAICAFGMNLAIRLGGLDIPLHPYPEPIGYGGRETADGAEHVPGIFFSDMQDDYRAIPPYARIPLEKDWVRVSWKADEIPMDSASRN